MTLRKSRNLWALALALAAAGMAAGDARAGAIPYGTSGWVDTPNGADASALTFEGTTGTVLGQGSLNLGKFSVSAAAQQGPVVDYTGETAHLIVYSGKNQQELITGTLSGSVGKGVTAPLKVTFDPPTQFGSLPLPFALSVATGVPMTLSNSSTDGQSVASTIFSAAASPIPEPSSVAVFGAALSGLALWRRRAAR